MSKHTPGPWKKGGGNDCAEVFPNICKVYGTTRGRRCNPRHAESQANAHLIAASPVMYHALKMVVREGAFEGWPGHLQDMITDAIAAAEGES